AAASTSADAMTRDAGRLRRLRGKAASIGMPDLLMTEYENDAASVWRMLEDVNDGAVLSIFVEHLLNLVRLGGLAQSQLQQDARLLRAEIVGGDETRLLPVV